MLFTSYEFLGFIAVVFLLYYILPKKTQWPLLLVASYLFYFLADPSYVLFILATTVSTYFAAKKLTDMQEAASLYVKEHKEELSREEKKEYKALEKKKQHTVFLWCLLFNLGILAVLKYTNFTIANINGLLNLFKSGQVISYVDIVLPMGISFYTFQTMSYLIDVYRGSIKAERNFFKLALFVSFFPQLVQGPISRFSDLGESLFAEHSFDGRTVKFGLERILWGYFKKVVIADRIVVAVNEIIHNPDTYTGFYVFLGMMFYAVELYCDFTGGIDITIGIAETMGIKVKENFERPYFSKNIKEYWNRWHITMGSWFTDYIFYPISVSKPMLDLNKWSRKHLGEKIGKRVPVYTSAFVVWFATGFWHGASWNFIVWGLGNYVVIMVSQELEPFYEWFHSKVKVEGTFGWKLFRVIRTILIMSSLRLFDCYRDVPLTFKMFGSMFTTGNWGHLFDGSLMKLGLSYADYGVLTIGVLALLVTSLLGRRKQVRDRLDAKPVWVQFALVYAGFLVVLVFGAYGIGFDASQFIYNQF